MKHLCHVGISVLLGLILAACQSSDEPLGIQDLSGLNPVETDRLWLSHEHILVDFIGADSIGPVTARHGEIAAFMLPYLQEAKAHGVEYFVDATPAYLGRDVALMSELARQSGLKILTNTGFYGARQNKYVPGFVRGMTAPELSELWIRECEEGIDGTDIRPGFIKIGVDPADPLDPLHDTLVRAAALTHLATGLTIASHTGEARGMWPQLRILEEAGVSPEAFIWVHAQNENDPSDYLKAAAAGCWISFDGLGWELDGHLEKILFAKEHGFLDRVLLSHDAGWFDPQKEVQNIVPYTAIFESLHGKLTAAGFTEEEFMQLMSRNPARAFAIGTRPLPPK